MTWFLDRIIKIFYTLFSKLLYKSSVFIRPERIVSKKIVGTYQHTFSDILKVIQPSTSVEFAVGDL